MRAPVLLCLSLLACSDPNARASSAAAPAPPPAPAKELSAPAVATAEKAPFVLSKLTGVRIEPAALVQRDPADKMALFQRAFAEDKVKCKSVEGFRVPAAPNFRMTNAIAGAALDDAKAIGWRLAVRKEWGDATIFKMDWHAVQALAFIVYDRDEALIAFCDPEVPGKK